MSTQANEAPIVHLVGSIPLDDAVTVFRTVVGAVGPHLTRLPDGEIGDRKFWVRKIQNMLAASPDFEPDPDIEDFKFIQWDGKLLRQWRQLRFRPGVDPDRVKFDAGYARAAQDSFAIFDRMQREGVIPAAVKFQICLPTPLAPAYNAVSPNSRRAFARVFGRHMMDEVAAIARALPNDRIAIQWDVCQEVLAWEGYYGKVPATFEEDTIQALASYGDGVPASIEMGYHLCYGSPADEHLIQPKDAGVMVEMTNRLMAAVMRPVEFMHLPVPKPRTDDAFYAPLDKLKLKPGTALYLGLVHDNDADGNVRRLALARRHVKVDGIGTECGWGRADPARIPGILKAHRELAQAG